ncbi:hypothetical protein J437_LFUL007499 [Ladona fulva]|uniref:Ferritin n=1 Tax=Ladona fulva TaxID=123851 RepID=A0A8K0KKV8_LADFU|nr:hypothetical protein J437_LFUL007499 [Ladona fulva]
MQQVFQLTKCRIRILGSVLRSDQWQIIFKGQVRFFNKYQSVRIRKENTGEAYISACCKMSSSEIRQHFHKDCEDGINNQINMELYASYVYLSMSHYFERDDVALKGFQKYFEKASDEEREHARKLMTYQNKRGGRVTLSKIAAPDKDDWGTPEDAMTAALNLEKVVNESLLNLHQIATKYGDANFTDFLETEYLQEQVESIKEIGDQLTNIKRVGSTGLGIYIYDQDLLKRVS